MFYFVLGLLLGQFAIRNWKWAALCGLKNALAQVYLLPKLRPSLALQVIGVVVSFPLLLGVSGLKHLPMRVGAAVLTVPFVAAALQGVGALVIFAFGGLLSAVFQAP